MLRPSRGELWINLSSHPGFKQSKSGYIGFAEIIIVLPLVYVLQAVLFIPKVEIVNFVFGSGQAKWVYVWVFEFQLKNIFKKKIHGHKDKINYVY